MPTEASAFKSCLRYYIASPLLHAARDFFMYTVYVLHSKNYDRLYIGMTSNLKQRMMSHNSLAKRGFTMRYRPWTLIGPHVLE